MKQLYDINPGKSKHRMYLFLIFSALITGFVFENIYYVIAILIFSHQAYTFFTRLGKVIPIRSLIGMMFSINYLLSPVLMFSWLNPYVAEIYSMKGEPEVYFAYAIPAMLLFIFGLNLMVKKHEEEVDLDAIKDIVSKNPRLPLNLIIAGIISSLLVPFAPSEWSLIFVAISFLKFIGFFLSILGGMRFNVLYFALSFGIIIIQSFITSLFSDLLYLSIFLAIFLSLRYQPSIRTTFFGVCAGLLLIVFIQTIKFNLRSIVTGSVSDLEMLQTVITESEIDNEGKEVEEKITDVVARIDQGWVASGTIENYMTNGFSLQNGSHAVTILKSSILPRFLAPNKYKVGDRELFNTYSGHEIQEGTSIALGILADGYIDFGYYGIFVVFIYGLIINLFIKLYHRWSLIFPLAKVFISIGFLYAIKADTDTHSALGALIKVSLVVWLVLKFINYKYLSIQSKEPIKSSSFA